MIISIHQPQYLPWLPYLVKLDSSDIFIFLDSVDFQKNGLQNRNQIKTSQGATWLTVPVSQHLGQKIIDVKVDHKSDWSRKHLLTLQQCYRKAPFFNVYEKEIETLFSKPWDSLCDLNIELIEMMLSWMNIKTKILRSSKMKSTGKGSDLVLNLCQEVGASHYLSGIGGKNYLKEDLFKELKVDIIWMPTTLPNIYPQLYPKAGFINSLSAIDIIFNCGQEWRTFLPEKLI